MKSPEILSRTKIHRSAKLKPPDRRRRHRFLVVGGATTDHNLALPKYVSLKHSAEGKLMIELPDDVGKVLLDDYSATYGGNGHNLSMALGRLGGNVTHVTPSPDSEIIKTETIAGVDVVALYTADGGGAKRNSVILNFSDVSDRVTFGEEPERDYTIHFERLHNPAEQDHLPEPDVVILSSADGYSWPEIYRAGTDYAISHEKLLAVLPSSKQLKAEAIQNHDLHYALDKAHIICANRAELIKLLQARGVGFTVEQPSMLELILTAIETFGSDKYISVTDGCKPSLLATPETDKSTNRVLQLSSFGEGGPTPLGAGDAYAAALIQALATGEPDEFAIMQAAINGYMSTLVVDTTSGHQTPDQLARLMADHPDFKPIQIFPKPEAPSPWDIGNSPLQLLAL